MAGQKIEVIVVNAPGIFHIAPSSFVISQPTPDGSLQIQFCDDFVATETMTVTQSEKPGAEETPEFSFSSAPERIVYGKVKLSLKAAKGFVALLNTHIALLEQSSGKGNVS